MRRTAAALMGTAALAACTAPRPDGPPPPAPVPEQVLALAAPYQNLAEIEFREEDGCWWYWHDGPVERTLLPLRTPAGNPICRAADPAA